MKAIAWIFIVFQVLIVLGNYKTSNPDYDFLPIRDFLFGLVSGRIDVILQASIEIAILNLLAIGALILGRLKKDKSIIIAAILTIVFGLPSYF